MEPEPPQNKKSGLLQDYHIEERPDFGHFRSLVVGVLLVVLLSVGSAYDAQTSCIYHQADAILELVDDDNYGSAYDSAIQFESDKCIQMFKSIFPTCVFICLLGILLILCSHGVNVLQTTVLCAVLFTSMLVLQSYNVLIIMLKPKNSSSKNPYQSLGAVDAYGTISDNANLFYLTWFSEVLILYGCYQIIVCGIRLVTHQHTVDFHKTIAWYQDLYRLRFRTGIWTAALIACGLIVVSSDFIWAQVILPYITELQTSQEPKTMTQYLMFCDHNVPCRRTMLSWSCGVLTSLLCLTAIGLHVSAKRGGKTFDDYMAEETSACGGGLVLHYPRPVATHTKTLSLRTELILAVFLSILLGINAVLVTGVQGPAAKVGILYYASWFSLFLTLRLCLGCVEEYYNIDEETTPVASHIVTKRSSSDSNSETTHEAVRLQRVRGYFFLSVFGLVCGASAYDASRPDKDYLNDVQYYMICSPFGVSLLSFFLFCASLSKRLYHVVSKFCVGGLLSIVTFGALLVDLILTMHSESSWAVNSIGEIEVANLYYFNWASILTAGVQMTSYVQDFLGIKKLDYMSAVWIAICKVCFVILGASLHIWNTISDNCEFDEITQGSVTFCSRTVLAITVSLTGMLVGSLVVLGRVIVAACSCGSIARIQSHIEMVISLFLVFLFIAAVALITGIGGPGQSVGDLYYSTWLAFWVAIGIFTACLNELRDDDDNDVVEARAAVNVEEECLPSQEMVFK